jgi:hypothetical protein
LTEDLGVVRQNDLERRLELTSASFAQREATKENEDKGQDED